MIRKKSRVESSSSGIHLPFRTLERTQQRESKQLGGEFGNYTT
jgi:hypothetical protein